MDSTRFDALTRALGLHGRPAATRRSLLYILGGGLLSAGPALSPNAEARRRKRKGKRKKTCKGGKARCDGACVDLQTDRGNCGSCGAACVSDEHCQSGSCVSSVSCLPLEARCDDQCVDPMTDPAHCGECGQACTASETCLSGDCCRSPGTTCAGDGQCCSSGVCALIDEVKPNHQVCHLPSVSNRCCMRTGQACAGACDCCNNSICENQRCCFADGDQCGLSAECCSRQCGFTSGRCE